MIRMDDLASALRTAMPDLVEVGVAKDFGRLTPSLVRAPSAFVLWLGEQSGANRFQSQGLLDQRITTRFGVVMAIRDIASGKGGAALESAEDIRQQVVQFFGAYRPDGAEDVCLPVSGRLMGGIGSDGLMFVQDDFTFITQRRIQGAA